MFASSALDRHRSQEAEESGDQYLLTARLRTSPCSGDSHETSWLNDFTQAGPTFAYLHLFHDSITGTPYMQLSFLSLTPWLPSNISPTSGIDSFAASAPCTSKRRTSSVTALFTRNQPALTKQQCRRSPAPPLYYPTHVLAYASHFPVSLARAPEDLFFYRFLPFCCGHEVNAT
jgi:hypothetical protein